MKTTEGDKASEIKLKEEIIMALRNLQGWNNNTYEAPAACGTSCGGGDKPEEKPAACGSACGAGDKPAEKPAACGSACGAGDK
jgi:ACGX-repeat protein